MSLQYIAIQLIYF
ncbi:hypothetical protein D039_2431A, partial [Vibrio parahaemolyticus EKP-028]